MNLDKEEAALNIGGLVIGSGPPAPAPHVHGAPGHPGASWVLGAQGGEVRTVPGGVRTYIFFNFIKIN